MKESARPATHWLRIASTPTVAYTLLAWAAAGYSLVALELSLAHALPLPEPFLRIPSDEYFLWGTLFYAPVIVGAWLLASAAIHALVRLMAVKPDFDRVLVLTAFATGVGTLGTLIPDLVTSPLRALGVISEQAWEMSIRSQGGWFVFTWCTLAVYLGLFVAGYPLAVRYATRLCWSKAIGAGLAGFVVFQGFEYVFIR